MHILLTLGCIGVFGLSGATTVKNFRLFERLHSAPEGWTAIEKPAVDTELNFRIAVKEAHRSALEKRLYDVSTPGNRLYGEHLSQEDLLQYTRPTTESSNAVLEWLKHSGVDKVDNRGEWIHFTTTAEQANKLMSTNFKVYRHGEDKDSDSIRTTEVFLPQNVLPHVKMIHPTTRFVHLKAQTSLIHEMSDIIDEPASRVAAIAPEQSGLCGSRVLPKCVRKLYRIGDVAKVNGSPNRYTVGKLKVDTQNAGQIGIAGFLEQYARHSDLDQFVNEQLKDWKGVSFNYTAVNNTLYDENSRKGSEEANLDIQWSIAMSYPVPNHFYSAAGHGPLVPDLDQPTEAKNQNEPYLEFFKYMRDLPQPPHTISFSYGENEQSVPPSYANEVCDLIGQLGGRGVSVIFASGDTGAGSACQTNDGSKRTRFLPTFPAACPWVTSVGGTVGTGPERAVGFSSGGFSDLWPRPKYQDAAVSAYLKTHGAKWEGYYNSQGRGFPDISAQSRNFFVVDKGHVRSIGGTSASTPLVGGLVGLLNAHRLQAGQKPLGFLNPWIYESGPQMTTDIVNGTSTGCSGVDIYSKLETPSVAGAGWAAVKGWDPVTGVGTPLFDKMLELMPRASSNATLGGSSPAVLE